MNECIAKDNRGGATLFKNTKGESIPYMRLPGTIASPGEVKVAAALRSLNIKYVREISFPDFTTSFGGHFRYDFLLTELGIIFEYDGKEYHKHTKQNDTLKNNYCKEHFIPIYRFSGSDFFNMPEKIHNILAMRMIYKKSPPQAIKILPIIERTKQSSNAIVLLIQRHKEYQSTINSSETLNENQKKEVAIKSKKRAIKLLNKKFKK